MHRLGLAALLVLGYAVQARAADFSLKRVMLSSGGVGYFEYAAEVDGDDSPGLDAPLEQVDDILKSLVVFDAAGGVAGVELPGRDNTLQALGDTPLGAEALASPAAYLNALRGTEVTIQGPRPMTGRIMRAEPVTETTGRTAVQRTRVTVLSAEGLRQFVLEDADSVQISDPDLRGRVGRALESLRQDSRRGTRRLTVRLKGTGKRTVSVGYVAGAPLWKATYRLMLQPPGAPTARLQGWATLENQSGADWKDVTLTLQYGNPVTFRQALYQSYFVQRPEAPVEILGRVLPAIDTRARSEAMAADAMAPPPSPAPVMQVAPPMAGAASVARRGYVAKSAPPPPPMAQPAQAADSSESAQETIFTLARPVDLAAGHTANVPIIDREIPAPRMGLVPFQQAHPLAAVRVKNDGELSLPAGVLTLYDATGAASFAGDARLGGLPVGESRLLSFAQDLRTAVETKMSPQPDIITTFSVADGMLTYTVRQRQKIAITVSGPAREPRDLLLEIPKGHADQTLTPEDDKIRVTEQTTAAWRLALSLAPGETRTLTVWIDQPLVQSVALVESDETMQRMIVTSDALNPSARAALKRVLDLRADESRREAEVERLKKAQEDIEADEERIRKNLASVAPGDALRTRLTRALDADETKLEQSRKAIDTAQGEVDKAHRALTEAVAALKL